MKTSDLRIVVVDDNRDTVFTLALLLKRSGFDVASQICEANRALDCVKSELPHVVIMDIAMPGIDGYQLAQKIRAEVDPPPRLVAVSGLCTATDKYDAIAAGFDAHFAKPADWPILEALLQSYLQQHAAAPALAQERMEASESSH